MDTTWRIALSTFAATLFTSNHSACTQSALPPRQTELPFQQLPLDRALVAGSRLHRHHRRGCFLYLGAHRQHFLDRWIGFWLACSAAMLFIAAFTLPHGLSCWREFWRFHERRYHITLRFLAPLYAALCALGLVSTAVLMSR